MQVHRVVLVASLAVLAAAALVAWQPSVQLPAAAFGSMPSANRDRARDASDVKELRLDVSRFIQAGDRRGKKNFHRTLAYPTHLTGATRVQFP
jgi:hypothetical protein